MLKRCGKISFALVKSFEVLAGLKIHLKDQVATLLFLYRKYHVYRLLSVFKWSVRTRDGTPFATLFAMELLLVAISIWYSLGVFDRLPPQSFSCLHKKCMLALELTVSLEIYLLPFVQHPMLLNPIDS